MWIKIDAGNGTFYDSKIMEEEIEFSDSGKAQVPKEVGEELIEKYDLISATQGTEVKKDDKLDKSEVKNIG